MIESVQVHVRLIGEMVDVWRPVYAEPLGTNTYVIVAQPYDREIERWEFEPGDCVICEPIDSREGSFLAAVKRGAR